MKDNGRVVLGGLVLLAAVTVQLIRPLWDGGPPWLPPATVATTWICLLTGSALIASTRGHRGHDQS